MPTNNGFNHPVPPSASREAQVLAEDGSCQYRPADRLPVWHTDGTFKEVPEAGARRAARGARCARRKRGPREWSNTGASRGFEAVSFGFRVKPTTQFTVNEKSNTTHTHTQTQERITHGSRWFVYPGMYGVSSIPTGAGFVHSEWGQPFFRCKRVQLCGGFRDCMAVVNPKVANLLYQVRC